MKLYLAGPLFTSAEQFWNMELADFLGQLGYECFVPQDHKIPLDLPETPVLLFLMCKNGIDWADAVIANMDGPDPDSGTAWECGYAFGTHKPVIAYRTDFRQNKEFPQGTPFNLLLGESSTPLLVPGERAELVAYKIHELLRGSRNQADGAH